MKKTVLFLVSNEPPPAFSRKIALLDSLEDFDVHLVYWHRLKSDISMPLQTDLPSSNIHQISLPEPRGGKFRRILWNAVFFLRVLFKVAKLRPTAIHANNMDMWLMAFFLKPFARNVRLVLDLLDTRKFFLKPLLLPMLSFILKRTELVFVTSPKYVSDFLCRIKPNISERKILFVPNAPSRADFEGFKKKDNEDLVVGYIGAFRGREAIRNLVEIAGELRDEGLHVKVLFAGMGLDKPLVEELAEKHDFVTYSGPFNYQRDIKELYERIDLVYSVYYLDHNKKIHMSCRYSDAVVCNLPVIVQDGSYMADLVKINQTGYVLELGRWEELKYLLRQLCMDRSDLEVKSRNCEAIKEENIFETYSPMIIKAYSDLIY